MKFGIVGAGQIGGTLTRRLSALGHQVLVANSRGPDTLTGLASETGARAVMVSEAVHEVDVVVLTIPEVRVLDLPKGLFTDLPLDVPLIDTGNYYPRERDGQILAIEQGLAESRWVEQVIGRPVVKAFNNIYAKQLLELGKPAGAPGRIALPVAGDDPLLKSVVMAMVNELGFDPVDAGVLADSWRQQPGSPVYCTDLGMAGVVGALAKASRERTTQWTATPDSPGSFNAPA
ncbi:NADPH-dependent F420 reductase [Paraburkholderia tropica]|uniref:NADPH-dependent F420 reductase n=1 Tax=Paraburkholderia tropica TaxID=92647 RepID=UPI0016031F19|nr:NADPH-dependent F420 reductase [Paraburkholderia tropica]QNB16040.1 NADPH-dependent F420 reductase [Paraburkholderia tropica]